MLEADVCLEKAPSCIHTVFYHGSGLLRCDALGDFTGSARIKHDGFAKDILLFLGDWFMLIWSLNNQPGDG